MLLYYDLLTDEKMIPCVFLVNGEDFPEKEVDDIMIKNGIKDLDTFMMVSFVKGVDL